MAYFGLPWAHFLSWRLAITCPSRFSRRMEEAFDLQLRIRSRSYTPYSGFSVGITENSDYLFLGRELAELLGLNGQNYMGVANIYTPRLNSPSTYFVYCDATDPQKTIHNGKPSFLLVKIAKRGRPYEQVKCSQGEKGLPVVCLGCKTSQYISAMIMTVTVEICSISRGFPCSSNWSSYSRVRTGDPSFRIVDLPWQ